MMDFRKMMEQAQQVQFKLQEMQEKFKDVEVEGESGGGLVKVRMSCAGHLLGIDIDKSLMGGEDKETVEDLIVAAVNNSLDAKDSRIQDETKKMMEAMGLPTDAAGEAGGSGGGLPF